MNLVPHTRGDDLLIVVEERRIDAAVAVQFKDEMRRLTADADARVILDLGAVEFLDSSGLGALVAAMKQLRGGRRLELAALTPTVEKVFRLTRMDTVFIIHTTADEAVGGPARAT